MLQLTHAEIELNEEMGHLRKVTDYLPTDEHKVIYRGLFMNIMRIIQTLQPDADTEIHARQVLQILKDARYAAHLRRGRLLPGGRANTDYRKYKSAYTHALVTAVAVEGAIRASRGLFVPPGIDGLDDWLNGLREDSEEARGGPALWVRVLLPKPGLEWLKKDPMVWEDWLAYFETPESSLMAELGQQGKEWARTGKNPTQKQTRSAGSKEVSDTKDRANAVQRGATVNQPKLAGWTIVEAIKQSLADGSLDSCEPEAIVQLDRDGRTFLQVPQIFEWYQKKYAPDDAVGTIRNRFTKLAITERTDRRDIFKGRLSASAKEQAGVVITDASVLWETAQSATGTFVLEGVFPAKDQQPI